MPVVAEGPASLVTKASQCVRCTPKRQSVSKDTDWSDSFVVAEGAPCENLSPAVTEVSLRLQSALMVFLQLIWTQKSGPDLSSLFKNAALAVNESGFVSCWEALNLVLFCEFCGFCGFNWIRGRTSCQLGVTHCHSSAQNPGWQWGVSWRIHRKLNAHRQQESLGLVDAVLCSLGSEPCVMSFHT